MQQPAVAYLVLVRSHERFDLGATLHRPRCLWRFLATTHLTANALDSRRDFERRLWLAFPVSGSAVSSRGYDHVRWKTLSHSTMGPSYGHILLFRQRRFFVGRCCLACDRIEVT